MVPFHFGGSNRMIARSMGFDGGLTGCLNTMRRRAQTDAMHDFLALVCVGVNRDLLRLQLNKQGKAFPRKQHKKQKNNTYIGLLS